MTSIGGPDMTRVSVFVDGENISANHAPGILSAARALGTVDLVRVYGDAGLLKAWEEVAEFRLVHSGMGKNAADLLLCVDAMERGLGGACDAVVIASSDGDFRHLAERLREGGLMVVGMGQERAGMRFKASCSRFIVLRGAATREEERAAAAGPGEIPPQLQPPPLPIPPAAPEAAGRVKNLTRKIRAALEDQACAGRGLTLSELQTCMRTRHGVSIGAYPEKTWRGYLEARPQVFVLDPKGPEARVRFRPGLSRLTEIRVAAE